MLPDRVSNPGPLTYESGALPIALRGPARYMDPGETEKGGKTEWSVEKYKTLDYMVWKRHYKLISLKTLITAQSVVISVNWVELWLTLRTSFSCQNLWSASQEKVTYGKTKSSLRIFSVWLVYTRYASIESWRP